MELFICIQMDLALNNLQRLICNKTQSNKTNEQTSQDKNYHEPYNMHAIFIIKTKNLHSSAGDCLCCSG